MFRKAAMAMLVAAGVSMFTTASVARADDAPKIDNPEYKAWSKYKPDTTVTREMAMNAMGHDMTVTMVTTLVSVDGDKVVVSEQSTVMGHAIPAKTREIAAKIDADKKMGDSTGTEDVKIGDKTYTCKVYEFKGTPPGMNSPRAAAANNDTKGKIWASEDVPGGLVKMTAEGTNNDQPVKVTMTTTSFDAK